MIGFLLRSLISALGLWVASLMISGIYIGNVGTLLIAAVLLGVVNAIVRPVLVILTLPITIITLGLFLLVVNAAMLGLVALLLPNFAVSGFFSAVGGSIVISIVSWLASWFIGSRGRFEVLVARRR